MRWLWVGFVGMVRSVWVIGEWAESHWIIGAISFQKIYGFYSVEHHKAGIRQLLATTYCKFEWKCLRLNLCENCSVV